MEADTATTKLIPLPTNTWQRTVQRLGGENLTLKNRVYRIRGHNVLVMRNYWRGPFNVELVPSLLYLNKDGKIKDTSHVFMNHVNNKGVNGELEFSMFDNDLLEDKFLVVVNLSEVPQEVKTILVAMKLYGARSIQVVPDCGLRFTTYDNQQLTYINLKEPEYGTNHMAFRACELKRKKGYWIIKRTVKPIIGSFYDFTESMKR